MKAIKITEFGGPEVMQYLEVDEPVARDGEVILEVTGIGINYADTHQTEDSYLSKQELPLIPGLEVVGTFEGKRYLAGAAGAYAERVAVAKNQLIPIPDAITDGQALATFVQGTTAWHILKTMGHLRSGESVLIHAAAGGVGTIAIQLAKMWGAKVIAVASSDEKRELALRLGADVAIDAEVEGMKERIIEANGGKRVDLVLEMVGGKTFDTSLEALAPFGRIITFGMASRQPMSMIHPAQLMGRSQTVTGFWLANCFGSKELMADVIAELFTLIAAGSIEVIVGATYPLREAAVAHRSILARESTGKVVLDPRL
ncbi:MAG: quinone oxidoreductase family protein [Candidatus Nanopelagicaceae bacterium]|jgi:NADPH2:quinone reductase